MNTRARTKELREEYKMYVAMCRDARRLDGPDSRLARFFKRLANQVKMELQVYQTRASGIHPGQALTH